MDVVRKVFVLYTGGTFGMNDDETGRLVPQPLDKIKEIIIAHTILYERKTARESEEDVRKRIVNPDGFITLYQQLSKEDPKAQGKHYKILYKFDDLPKPIDSSSATPEDWSIVAKKILNNMGIYDGFLILHGTDTMSFTSSALSFFLGNVKKPVIVTGAQKPIFHPRSDGFDNFVSSMLIAGYFSDRPSLHKVMLCYQNKLYQGNRVVKVDCDSFSVFDSPEVSPLASLETTIKLIDEMKVDKQLNKDGVSLPEKVQFIINKPADVRMLRFYPGITKDIVCRVLDKAEGVVLETFGCGNVPEVDWLKACLINADINNVLMLNCTQVFRGTVVPIYAASKMLTEANVIPGYDITPVAAMAKMVWVLKLKLDHQKRRELMEHCVYGESSAPPLPYELEFDLKEL
ncbi:L-asparaginase 1-like [Salminus brasiliensis]|uniref:L-asparaginase 1-like n=1 Tax=Salminus brasiliensis TaxID=930266 RepID=UPI003B834865